MIRIPETHQQGLLSMENLDSIQNMDFTDCDFRFASRAGRPGLGVRQWHRVPAVQAGTARAARAA